MSTEQLPDSSLSTLQEFKVELQSPGSVRPEIEAVMYNALWRAAEIMEDFCNRRFMYRGGSIDESAFVCHDATVADGAIAVDSQPSTLRTLRYDVDGTASGTVTVIGVNHLGVSATETFSLSDKRHYGYTCFESVTSVAVSGSSGTATLSIDYMTPYVEYHSIETIRNFVYTLQRPIIGMFAVNQDQALNYGTATRLAPTDYVYDQKSGKITKIKGGVNMDFPEDLTFRYPVVYTANWFRGYRVLKLTYAAGIKFDAGRTKVPGLLKGVHLNLAAIIYREILRQQQNVQSVSDAAGGMVRYGPAALTREMKEMLRDEIVNSTSTTIDREGYE